MTTCRTHPDVPALSSCTTCSDPLCADCRRLDAFGRESCATCAARPVARRVKRPWLAWMLSVVPGLGQVYNGLPERGLVQFAIWCTVIFVLNIDIFGGFLSFVLVLAWLGFWFWCSLDAHATAHAINAAGRPLTIDEATAIGRGSLFGLRADARSFGVALCILGALLLLEQFSGVFTAVLRFALPIAMAGTGLWILVRAKNRRQWETAGTIDVDAQPGPEARA
jgi:hypothetical protein